MSQIILLLSLCCTFLIGCDTNTSTPFSVSNSAISYRPVLVEIPYEGKTVKAWAIDDGPWFQVVMLLDYPCGAIGPLPQGHGRDCGASYGTADGDGTVVKTASLPTPIKISKQHARLLGDPTADD